MLCCRLKFQQKIEQERAESQLDSDISMVKLLSQSFKREFIAFFKGEIFEISMALWCKSGLADKIVKAEIIMPLCREKIFDK